jgi:uncharacterized protein (TIGR02391 family)
MALPAPWPSAEEIVELEVDTLGIHILWALVEEGQGNRSQGRQIFVEGRTMQAHQSRQAQPRGMSAIHSFEAVRAEPRTARALSEAWEWLVGEELIALDAVTISLSQQIDLSDPYFVTRWGREVAAEGTKGLDLARARRRLGLELHPALARQLKRLVRVGAFEEAAFVALREIEQRVATLAGHPTARNGGHLHGDGLMTAAFREGGPLADPEAEPHEQQGLMNLFRGAFAAFRNPLGHRSVEFGDPTEAAEVVLFADLLMRQIDHVEERTGPPGPSSPMTG